MSEEDVSNEDSKPYRNFIVQCQNIDNSPKKKKTKEMDIYSDDMMLSSLITKRKERETVTKKGNKPQHLKFITRNRSVAHGSNYDDNDDDGSNELSICCTKNLHLKIKIILTRQLRRLSNQIQLNSNLRSTSYI